MVILKIRFFLRLRHCCCCLLRTVIIYLFSDFSKLFCKDDIHCHMLHYLCVRSVTSHRFLSSVYIQLIRKKKSILSLNSINKIFLCWSLSELPVRSNSQCNFWRTRSLSSALASVNCTWKLAAISTATCDGGRAGHCRHSVRCQSSLNFTCLFF